MDRSRRYTPFLWIAVWFVVCYNLERLPQIHHAAWPVLEWVEIPVLLIGILVAEYYRRGLILRR